jgi:uncharacterized repeat protein (TIGR01451 family)
MREARWRRVAVAVVVALLVPSLASAAPRRVRRVLPAGARAAAAAPTAAQAGDPQLESAVARLRASLSAGSGQAIAADEDQVYLARTSQGYVRALQAPAGHAFFVTRGTPSSPEGIAVAFLQEHGKAFGMSRAATGLRIRLVRPHLGRTFVRLEQRLGALPIFGAAAVVQVEPSGGISFVLADLARDNAYLNEPGFPTTASVASAQAVVSALTFVQARHQVSDLASTAPELMVYEPSVIGSAGSSQLVWYMHVRSAAAAVDEVMLVDAETGAVAFHYSDIKEAKNRQIYDSNNVAGSLGTLVRSEGQGPSGIADADLAYTYFGDTYDFYNVSFGRDSYDGLGGALVARVRWCEPFYTCPFPNAYWNGSEMRFGQGYASADDVVAHELTHGVTERESNLIYWGESGAMNEALSDIFGEFVDLTNSGGTDTPGVRWLLGEDLPIGAIRSMSDPTLFGDPDRRFSLNWYTGSDDNRGVHLNSGVANKLAYLLTDGDTFNGETVPAQGLSATARLLYEAQVNLLVPASDYYDLYAALRQAAVNLGWNGAAIAALEAACRAVEIDLPGATATIFSDGFEGAFPGAWAVYDQGGLSGTGIGTQWGRSSYRKASGSFSAYCAAGGTSPAPAGGPYPPLMDTWLVYGPFSLASVLRGWAEFDLFMDVEYPFDEVFWGVSTDGSTFDGYAVSPSPDGYTTGQEGVPGWAHELFNFDDAEVSGINGQAQVWLAFDFVSDDIVQYEGTYVDNVVIQKAVAQTADLQVTVTDGTTAVSACAPVSYTVQVTNGGPNPVANARVVDAFPGTLSGVTWTCAASAGSSCSVGAGSGDIDRVVSLLSGGSATFVATGALSPTATGTLSNTASVSFTATGTTDPVPGNNSATDADGIAVADVAVSKTDGRDTAAPGDAISYSIVASNAGPTPMNGVSVSDPVPADLTGSVWTCVPAGGATCTASGSGSISDTINLPVGGTATYTLSGTVSANPASLANTATISSSCLGDPVPGNNSSSDTDILLCGNTTSLTPDGRVLTLTLAPGATQWLLLGTYTGYSYSLEAQNRLGTSGPGTLTLFRGVDGCTGTSTDTTARDTSSIDPAAPTTAVRLAFTSSGADPNYRLRLTNSTAGSVDYDLSLAETAFFSPAWSTNGTYNTYYSFQNTTGSTITATLTLTKTDGSSAGSSNLTIPAGATASTNTAALVTPRNATGTARLTHDGPPGALLAEAAIANFSTTPAYIQPVKFKTVRELR